MNRVETANPSSTALRDEELSNHSRKDDVQDVQSPEKEVDGTLSHPLLYEATGPQTIVDFDGPDDPFRPLNWPLRKKVWVTLAYGLMTAAATWETSV